MIDLITMQSKVCDYPLWRKWLRENRHRFNKCIIYFNENNRFPYLDHFIHDSLKDLDCLFLDQATMDWSTDDFRTVAVREMLKHTTSEWVASVEGDFFARDWDKLFDKTTSEMASHDLIGYRGYKGQEDHQYYLTDDYVHPGFWFMRKDALDLTSKFFGANQAEGYDHFGLITREAREKEMRIKFLDEMGFIADVREDADCFHLGNVNHSYLEGFAEGFIFPKAEWFYLYNYYSMRANVVQSLVFQDIMERMHTKLQALCPYVDPGTDPRSIFFR